jgi:integrase
MRPPKIQSRKRPRGTYYYCSIGGRQRGLGYDYETAKREFSRLIGGREPEPNCDQSVTVGELVAMFDDWSRSHTAKRTADDYVYWLVRWCSSVGEDLPASAVTPNHIDQFVSQSGLVGTWAHVKIVRSVRRLFRWAEQQHRITLPSLHLSMPRKPDSPQAMFSPLQVWYLWRSSSRDFRPLLRWYYATGCRPEESRIKCEWVNTQARQVVIPAASAKGKRRRIINYPPKLDRMIQRCLTRSRTGWLFETRKRVPFTRWAIDTRHDRIRKRQPGLYPDGCYARMWRYTFATVALKRGLGPMTVAHLMGHKDLSMLTRHYEKLGLDREHLQDAIAQIWRTSREPSREK